MAKWAIHPELQIRVKAKRNAYRSYFDNEYARVSGKKGDDPLQITARIVRKLPEAIDGDVRRTLRFKKFFKYDYVVRGLFSDEVEIFFKDTWAGRLYTKAVTLFLQAQIIEPIAYLKLLERDILFMHAAGVSDGKHGYLLPAFGGTGKTTMTLGLMGEGMQVLGDDLLLVNATDGTVGPYLRPLHIFTYNVKTLRDAKLPWTTRFIVRFKDVVRVILETVTRQEFLISTRVHAEDIYPDFHAGKRVPYRRIAFLVKEGDDRVVGTKAAKDLTFLVDTVLESEDLNDSLYANIIDPADKDRVVELERAVIADVLKRVPEVWFINTRKRDFRKLGEFRDQLVK